LEIFLGQGSPIQQFTKIFLGLVSIDKIGVSKLSFFPQDPLPGEGPGIAFVDTSVPTGPIPKYAVLALRTLDGVVLESREIS
jgi:hypothetical protein